MTRSLSYLIGIIITILIGMFLYFTLCSDCQLASAENETAEEEIVPMNGREATVGFVLLVSAIILGVYPAVMFDMMRGSMALLVESLEHGYQVAEQAVQGTASLTP